MRAEGSRYGTEAVDGLRGVAIAFVVFYHTWLFSWFEPRIEFGTFRFSLEPWAATGFLGVDLFFFVSGFVLFFPYARAMLSGAPAMGVRDFAQRRFWKIVPSYLIALIAAALYAIPYVHDSGEWWRALAVHLVFLHEFWWERYRDANGVFWSLAIEVQFYAVFPLIAWCARRWTAATFLVLIAGAFEYRIWTLHDIGNEPLVRAMPSYVDVFAIGMLTAFIVVWLKQKQPAWMPAAWVWTAVALLATIGTIESIAVLRPALDLDHGRETWQVYHRTTLAALVSLLTLGTMFGVRWWQALIANPLTIALSLISYNLYLWHGFLDLVFLQGHFPPWPADNNPHGSELWKMEFVPLAVTAGIALATIMTYFVERPILSRFVKPQTFSFDWSRLRRRSHIAVAPPPATSPAEA